jgi:hypothetical protein
MPHKNKLLLACPDCPKKYNNLKDLNQHIKKSGCNNSEKIQLADFFEVLGIDKIIAKFSSSPFLSI